MGNWKDRLGIFASAACAVHCAATPVLLATLPALKFTEWMASPVFHQLAAVACCGIVAVAIWPSFLRFRDYRILSLSSLGLGLILSAAFVMPDKCCTQEVQVASKHDHAHDHDHGHADHGHADHGQSPTMQLAGIGSFQAWMTPLGGVFLMFAHGLNLRLHHRGRKCTSAGCSDPGC